MRIESNATPIGLSPGEVKRLRDEVGADYPDLDAHIEAQFAKWGPKLFLKRAAILYADTADGKKEAEERKARDWAGKFNLHLASPRDRPDSRAQTIEQAARRLGKR